MAAAIQLLVSTTTTTIGNLYVQIANSILVQIANLVPPAG
jgi:hypothetical protein